tara:strand:- start:2142 stop:2753 length:612 start_codon:yes stop_codon:yes gene_type:complete
MVNAWSLAYDVLNGTLDENYPIMTKDNEQKVPGRDVSDIAYGGLYPEQCSYYQPQAESLNISFNPDETPPWVYESPDGGETVTRRRAGSLEKEVIQKPEPNLEYKSQKYEEDAGIKDLKDYISSTYSGHYTSEQNNTQTLDLIQSVGDAESFCRSNAIKYLARYDRKGQAKRDILKAMHYCLLLYYFSGHTNNETPTRGYETF